MTREWRRKVRILTRVLKKGIIHQNQFLEEDVSHLIGTPRAKLKVIKEYEEDKSDHGGRKKGN